MKTLINMKCLILQIQTQCPFTYCANLQNIMSIEKLMLCTYYFGVTQRAFVITWVLQLLSQTIPFGKGSASVQVAAEWMCQQPWDHPQQSFCFCASEHMILSSENKFFHNIVTIWYFLDLSSIFKEPACEKWNLSGAGNFFWLFAPYNHGTFIHSKQQKNNLQEIFFRQFLSVGRIAVDWLIFLCNNSCCLL